MLEHLFGSRTRVKLLGLFLRKPEEALFVREITRRVGTQINAVRRELQNLVSFGLITETAVEDPEAGMSRRPGLKRRYYKANQEFPLLNEVTSLVVKAQVLLERRLDQDIMKLGEIQYLAFLGPFLGKPKAPVDLFIVGVIDKQKFARLLTQAEQDLGFEINFSVMTPDEFKYRKDITDKFLYSILESPKNVALDRLANNG